MFVEQVVVQIMLNHGAMFKLYQVNYIMVVVGFNCHIHVIMMELENLLV
jgi:hypothetical protein